MRHMNNSRPLHVPDAQTPITIDGMLPIQRFLSDFRMYASLRQMLAHSRARPLMTRLDFMQQITLYLPEVSALIEESDFGILHLEVGALKLATRQALRQYDFGRVRRHLFLVGNLFEHADAELREALHLSYLEPLFLGETSIAHREARSLLSKPMEEAVRQSELRFFVAERARLQAF
jgi:hypothetical protein